MKRKLSTSGVDPGAARRPGQNRRSVLEQLDAPVERPAVDHVESDIGIAVVDPLPAAASGDDGKDNHAEAVHEAAFSRDRHKVRLPMVRIGLEPLAFISRTASMGSLATSCVF